MFYWFSIIYLLFYVLSLFLFWVLKFWHCNCRELHTGQNFLHQSTVSTCSTEVLVKLSQPVRNDSDQPYQMENVGQVGMRQANNNYLEPNLGFSEHSHECSVQKSKDIYGCICNMWLGVMAVLLSPVIRCIMFFYLKTEPSKCFRPNILQIMEQCPGNILTLQVHDDCILYSINPQPLWIKCSLHIVPM